MKSDPDRRRSKRSGLKPWAAITSLEPIPYELGIISNLDDLFVRKQSLLRDPNKRRRGNDICHDKLMMFSTGGLHSIPR